MNEEQVIERVLEGLRKILAESPNWGEIVVQISKGEPRHVNITLDIAGKSMVK